MIKVEINKVFITSDGRRFRSEKCAVQYQKALDRVPTVAGLRKDGVKVRVMHYRNSVKGDCLHQSVYQRDGQQDEISPYGGKTVVEVTYPDGQNFIGEAVCSAADRYEKKAGVRFAMKRLKPAFKV